MIKIGVIGSGKWGKNHLKDLSKMNVCKLIGLADLDENKKELAEKHSILFFNDYKKMLPHIDAVTIVTPTNTHYTIAKACLEQGKHVFVEKPLCFEQEKANELVRIAKERNLLLSVGYVFRFNPLVKRLKELLPEIGPIQYISSRYIHSTVPPRKDSGVIFNLGVHLIDTLNYILPKQPKNIHCNKINYISPTNEDSAIIKLDYGSFLATIETSCCHPLKKRDMWVIAAKEKIYLDFLDQIMIRHPITVSEEGTSSKEALRDPKIEKGSPLFEELWHFCTICQDKNNGKEVQNESAENPLTTKMCLLALQSAQENKVIDLEYGTNKNF
jgi:UDP-N-acetylglucosamine 3-dehydrogenase